ncbi:TPA: MarR family transcriptional regulator, partial [Enterococcus faecium]|nr:MarR family transcriptional regulator [Enterococcus faecium]
MDKRQLLIEEYLDLANEIIHRNKPEMEKEFAGFTLNELEVIEHIGKIPDPNVTK